MQSLLYLISSIIGIYIWVVIIHVIISWLTAFQVINRHNQLVSSMMFMSDRLTKPALRPIRRYMPDLGGVDISPVVLLLLLYFFRNILKFSKTYICFWNFEQTVFLFGLQLLDGQINNLHSVCTTRH